MRGGGGVSEPRGGHLSRSERLNPGPAPKTFARDRPTGELGITTIIFFQNGGRVVVFLIIHVMYVII